MSAETKYADWIALDWGTSNVRAWAMRNNQPVDETASDRGMGGLKPEEFEPVLLDLIEPWLGQDKMTIVACGMVGARQGWIEAPYSQVPCPPVGTGTTQPKTNDQRLDVHILPGLSQTAPADVMRGEETQIAGFLAENPEFDGVLCLPGTHTKWTQISAGEVVSFRTFMTGEMFALLSKQSVLRHSMHGGWEDAAFLDAVREGMANPQALAGRFFGLRAAGLVGEQAAGVAPASLSGLLIGAELAASKPYWLGQRVALLGAQKLSALYAAALDAEGVQTETHSVTHATLAGLGAAHDSLKD